MLDSPTLVDPPNYVGTFDQFFHRYVLTVDVHRRFGKAARYVSSWDDLPEHLSMVRPSGGGAGFRLSLWTRQSNGEWIFDEERLSRRARLAWTPLPAGARRQVKDTGSRRIASLCDAHLYDTTESRARALAALADPKATYLALLQRRFHEVIVDEFQDCDKVEHELLDLLTTAGIHVVTVADPDQAIYEFRQATSGLYEEYRDGLAPASVARLTTCHRSAPAICAVSTSFRCVGVGSVVPSPEHVGGASVVHVIVGSGHEAGSAGVEIARRNGVSVERIRVIALRRNDARSLLRRGNQPPGGTSQMESLLVPVAELHAGTDTRGRLAAVRRVEAFVLSQFAWPTDLETRDDQLELLEVRAEQLRMIASQILVASRGWNGATDASAGVRSVLRQFAAGRSVGLVPSLGQRVRVQPGVWQFWQSRTDGLFNLRDAAGAQWAHVHGVKGDEFDGVILALPSRTNGSDHVLDDWENGRNTEQRRVLYVGATRASKILVLVVPPARRDQLVRILVKDGVPHEVTELAPSRPRRGSTGST